jgi:hypothetical protein
MVAHDYKPSTLQAERLEVNLDNIVSVGPASATKKRKKKQARCWWLMPVILATHVQRSGGSRFDVSQGKQLMRPYLEKTHHRKRASGSRCSP